jgi:hypothetical protein
VKLSVNWHVDGDSLGMTVHYFQYSSGAPSAADLSTFCSSAVSNGLTAFQATCNDSVGMFAATARDLASNMGNEATAGTPWVGTRGTALTAPGAAVVVSHSISRHYRGGHPRTYLPCGVAGDIATTGLWTTGLASAVDTAWGTWAAAMTSTFGSFTTTHLVNVSYMGPPNRMITGSTGRVRTVSTVRAIPIVDVVTGHVTRNQIGSQRRRNRDA